MLPGNPEPAGMLTIRHWDPIADGALSESALRRKLTELGYECRRYDYPPGTVFPDHNHTVDKIDAVLAGRFRIRSGGEIIDLEAGDYIHIPKGTVHSAEVIGDETVISIDGVKKQIL